MAYRKTLSEILDDVTRFGRLVVIGDAPRITDKRGNPVRRAHCQCDCGNLTDVYVGALKSGATQSCGCFQKEKFGQMTRRHGHVSGGKWTAEYRCWAGMVQRCTNPAVKAYDYYGGRGIVIAPRWRDSFEAFFSDMGPKPSALHSIDRIDSNGNYEPGNCRWALKAQQSRNMRSNRRILWRGKDWCIVDAAREAGIALGTLEHRLKRGMCVNEALTAPIRGRRK